MDQCKSQIGRRAGQDQTNRGVSPPHLAARTEAGAAAKDAVQDEEASAGNEQYGTGKRQKDIEFGAVVAVFSFAVMMSGFFLGPEAKRRETLRLDISMLLAFASFICGFSFMLLSMQLLGLPETHVSGCHRAISKCLFYICSVLPALTLLSLLVVMPYKPYVYVGLAVLAMVAVPIALLHCYVRRTAEGATDAAAELEEQKEVMDAAAELEEQKEVMEAGLKITWAITNSSLTGLVGMLFGVYKLSGGGTTPSAVHVAIMFMFGTAVVSMLLVMLSMKVLDSNNRKHRGFIVPVIRYANAALLCSLAIAAFTEAFVILKCYIFAAFVSPTLAAIVHFIIQHCTTAQRASDQVDNGKANPNREMQLKWMADMASKVTAYSLGGVMAIFGGFLGDTDKTHEKTVAIKICMFLLTSAYASGLGLMLLTIRPRDSARVGFNAAITILVWSAMGLLAASALAIYGVEVMKS